MTVHAEETPPHPRFPIRCANPDGGVAAHARILLPISLEATSNFLLHFQRSAPSSTLIPLLFPSICYTHSGHTLEGEPQAVNDGHMQNCAHP